MIEPAFEGYWEPESAKLEDLHASAAHPAPWKIHGRGNGHHDIYDANGKYVAYQYCWDLKDYDALAKKLEEINKN